MENSMNEFDDRRSACSDDELADDAQAYLDGDTKPRFDPNAWRDRLPSALAVVPATSGQWYVLSVSGVWDADRERGFASAYCHRVHSWLQAVDRHGFMCLLPMTYDPADGTSLRPAFPHNGLLSDHAALIGPDDDPYSYLTRTFPGWEIKRHGEFPVYDDD